MKDELNAEIQEKIRSLANQFARARFRDIPPNLNVLVPPEVKMSQLRYAAENELSHYLQSITQGVTEIIPVVERLVSFEPEIFTAEVQEELGNICKNEIEFEKIALDSLVNYSEQNSIQALMKISDSTMKALYRIGVECYNSKCYKEAANIYTILALLDPTAADYWLNLGDAEFFNQSFTGALYAYAMAALNDPSDPTPHFYAARCYEELKQYDFAINSLDVLLDVIEDGSDKDAWVEKAQNFKSHLQELVEHSS